MSNQYSIVIPSRNFANLTACVNALRDAGETARVIVVDDFKPCCLSRDEFVRAGLDLSRDLIMLGDDPFIFARNVNIGIAAATTDDVVLLNDDALLKTPIGFSLLRQQSIAHPEFGAICPGFDIGGCRHTNLVNQRRPSIAVEPTMLIFACCYIPRTTINLVGLLDERFGINAGGPGPRGYGLEDDDYSLRIRETGLKLGVYDGVLVDHTTLRSTFRFDPEHKADVRLHEDLFKRIHGHWPEGHGMDPTR
jgi:GT2 family glycosyltransferase